MQQVKEQNYSESSFISETYTEGDDENPVPVKVNKGFFLTIRLPLFNFIILMLLRVTYGRNVTLDLTLHSP